MNQQETRAAVLHAFEIEAMRRRERHITIGALVMIAFAFAAGFMLGALIL